MKRSKQGPLAGADPELYQRPKGGALHSGLLCRACLRPKSERNVFTVPQRRRPGNRTTPLEVARLMVQSRDQGSRN
jgi:hypothetical protein